VGIITQRVASPLGCWIQSRFGHVWHLVTHIEDVSPEEMKRRYEVLLAGGKG
jgi:hypothetical protein